LTPLLPSADGIDNDDESDEGDNTGIVTYSRKAYAARAWTRMQGHSCESKIARDFCVLAICDR